MHVLFLGLVQATLRRFTCDDMFRFNSVNLDVLTETVRISCDQ
jgi:hypothetical protein